MAVSDNAMIVFGDRHQWGISTDDGCLRFHPNLLDNPKQTSPWIWREAWEQVEQLGGFERVVEMLREEQPYPKKAD